LSLPQELAVPKQKRALTNIQFCVDISGSMTAKFGQGSRYDAAMKAINEFLDFRTGDSFGLTFFGNNYLHWVPLTSDPSAFRCCIPFMRPENNVPGFGGTEIGKAVLGCREMLVSRSEGDRMLILVTDGWSSDLEGGAEIEIAKRLKRDGITLFAVNIQESEARGEIVNMARLTGGEVFNPGDTRALGEVQTHRPDDEGQARTGRRRARRLVLPVLHRGPRGARPLRARAAGPQIHAMVTLFATAGALLLALVGELLHSRRVRRVARLAFGSDAAPARGRASCRSCACSRTVVWPGDSARCSRASRAFTRASRSPTRSIGT
jgi:hypothetical protein